MMNTRQGPALYPPDLSWQPGRVARSERVPPSAWWIRLCFLGKARPFHCLVFFLFFFLAVGFHPAYANVPKMLNYQGRMTNSSDELIDGTTYYYQFEFYDDPTAGSLIWSSQEDFHSTCGVAITPSNGVFNIIVGDDTINNMSDVDVDFDADPYYLQIKISATQSNNVACEGTLGAGASYETLTPRQRVVSSGFAFTARELSGDYNEKITNPADDILAFSGLGGGDDTNLYFNLDGTYPVVYSNADTAVGLDDDLIFVGAQAINTSTGNLTLSPAGNLVINTTGGTIDIDDGIIDLSSQTVDITLNSAADALNFDSNTLSIDAASNYIGIGTAAPAAPLHIYQNFGNNYGQLVLQDPDTDGASAVEYLSFYDSNSRQGYLGFSTTNLNLFIANEESTGDILLTTNGGNIGINDSDPDYPLEILSTVTPQLAISHTDGSAYTTLQVDAGGDLTIDASGGDVILNSGDNLNLTASTDLIFGTTTSLGETTGATDSGAYVVGAFDEFSNSAETNVQGVLDDLDQAIVDLQSGSAGLWRDGGTYIYPGNVGTTFQIADTSGNLTLPGTIVLPNSNTIQGVVNYTQFSAGVSVGGGTTYYLNSAGTANLNAATFASTLTANGPFTLGDGGDAGSINTSDWDINTSGDMTAIGSITADGSLTISGAGPHDIQNTLNTDTLAVDVLLDVNEDVDIDLDAADEEIRITQAAVAGTEYPGSGDPTGLIFIDDNRTGTTTDELQEATMVFDAEGTYALAVLDGDVYFEDVAYFGTANTYFDASGNLSTTGTVTIANATSPALTINSAGTGYIQIGGSIISDASGNLTLDSDSGTITIADAVTISANNAGISFSGTGTHAISAAAGTLQLGAVTLGGAVTGNSQSITGLGQLTVDNLRLDGNTVDTTSGNLTLDSTGGTTQVNDNLDVVGNTTSAAGYADFGSYLRATDVRSEGDIYVNYDGADGDSNLYFYDNSSPTSEYLRWDDVTGYGDGTGFYLSDDLELVGDIRKNVASSNLVLNSAGASAGVILQTGGTDKVTVSANGDLTLNNSSYGFVTFGELAAAPTGAAGRQYYNTTNDMMYYYDGTTTSWRSMQGVTVEQFAPEYENSVTAGDGTNNDGTMITGYEIVSNNTYTFYQWTSSKAAVQDYDIVLHARVPTNFVSWATNAVALNYKTGLADNTKNYIYWEIYEDGNATALMTSANLASTSWTTDSATSAELANLAAGDTFRIVIKLAADNSASAAAYAGFLTLYYR